jgi:hypothetical protein
MTSPRTTVGRRALSALELLVLLGVLAAVLAGAVVSAALQLAAALPH